MRYGENCLFGWPEYRIIPIFTEPIQLLMNKIILIGNGFDIHNGYPTDYKSFFNWLIVEVINGKIKGDDIDRKSVV